MSEIMVYVEATGRAITLSKESQRIECSPEEGTQLAEKLVRVLGLKVTTPAQKTLPVEPEPEPEPEGEAELEETEPEEVVEEEPAPQAIPAERTTPQPVKKAAPQASETLQDRAKKLGQKRAK